MKLWHSSYGASEGGGYERGVETGGYEFVLDESKANDTGTYVDGGPAPVRDTQGHQSLGPATAPYHTLAAVAAVFSSPRRPVWGRTVVVVMPAILYPFPHITRRVVQTERIWLE